MVNDGVIDGLRVVDLSRDVAGAFGTKLLAMYGADVIKVEPPEGDPTRFLPPIAGEGPDAGPDSGVLYAYLNTGKRSVVLDIDEEGDRGRLLALLRTADAIVESFAPGELAARGVDLDALMEERPALVVCSITPYGQDGPLAGWRATPLTAIAHGGQLAMCGDLDAPPLKQAGPQAYYQAGLHAFSATATALFAAQRTGVGDRIDLAVREVVSTSLEGSGPNALWRGGDSGRSGNVTFQQWGIHPCADGYIGFAAMPRQTPAIYDLIEQPHLKTDPAVMNGWSPAANELQAVLIPEWTARHTAKEIFERASLFRTPVSMIPTPRELLEWPGLVETGFWREVEHPALGRHPLPAGPIAVDGFRGHTRPAPLLGQHTAEVLAELEAAEAAQAPAAPSLRGGSADRPAPPLDGIRIVDTTQIWAGPFATKLLGDMGADVIKVEGPRFADGVRTMAGATSSPDVNLSSYFNEYNRNKRSLALDLQSPEGMDAMRRIVAQSDVFIENWSSGVAKRMGLGYEDLRAIKPDIIVVSMPGFGHDGPDAERVGFGPTIEQMGGLVALQGYEGGPPHRSGISYGDPIAGIAASGAVALALLKRERTGEGSYVVVPQRDVIVSLIGEFILAEALGCPLPTRIGSRDPLFAPHNVYQCRDDDPPRQALGPLGNVLREMTDTWVAIAVDRDEAWQALRGVIGDLRLDDPAYETAAGRKAHEDAIDAVIAGWARPLDALEAATRLQAAGVAAAPVLSPLRVTQDEHLHARGMIRDTHNRDMGPYRIFASPWHLARRPVEAYRGAPCFGEHTREVLAEVAGLSDAEIDALFASGVAADSYGAPQPAVSG